MVSLSCLVSDVCNLFVQIELSKSRTTNDYWSGSNVYNPLTITPTCLSNFIFQFSTNLDATLQDRSNYSIN